MRFCFVSVRYAVCRWYVEYFSITAKSINQKGRNLLRSSSVTAISNIQNKQRAQSAEHACGTWVAQTTESGDHKKNRFWYIHRQRGPRSWMAQRPQTALDREGAESVVEDEALVERLAWQARAARALGLKRAQETAAVLGPGSAGRHEAVVGARAGRAART